MNSIYRLSAFFLILVQFFVPFFALAVDAQTNTNTTPVYISKKSDLTTELNPEIQKKILGAEKIEKISDILLPIESKQLKD